MNGLGERMEEWYSTTTKSISNPAIYITETLSRITVAVQEFAIAGYDTNAPFDSNSATPANMTAKSNTMSATISTSDAQDMLLGFAYGGNGTLSPEPGFSGICLNVSPCSFSGVSPNGSEYEIITKTQTGSAVSMTQSDGVSWGFIADAVQSASPSVISLTPSKGPTGTTISIKGASFTSVVTVRFCGVSQPAFNVVGDTMITTIAPELLSPPSNQTCHITVTNNAGSSLAAAADQFSFLPSVKSVTPTSGGNGTLASITGTSFVGNTTVALCGVSQPKFTVTNDTQIWLIVSGLAVTTSRPCDVVVTNSVGKSLISNSDTFTYFPPSRSGGATNHSPNTLTNSDKVFYITIAGIAAVALFAVAGLMRRWDPGKKEQRHGQSREEPANNPPLPARQVETRSKMIGVASVALSLARLG